MYVFIYIYICIHGYICTILYINVNLSFYFRTITDNSKGTHASKYETENVLNLSVEQEHDNFIEFAGKINEIPDGLNNAPSSSSGTKVNMYV
jgi:hypothetical protein